PRSRDRGDDGWRRAQHRPRAPRRFRKATAVVLELHRRYYADGAAPLVTRWVTDGWHPGWPPGRRPDRCGPGERDRRGFQSSCGPRLSHPERQDHGTGEGRSGGGERVRPAQEDRRLGGRRPLGGDPVVAVPIA